VSHGRLKQPTGVFPAGAPYSAEDPALVLWVHATFMESAVLVYERLIAPVSEADRDRYCDEGAGCGDRSGCTRARRAPRWRSLESYCGRRVRIRPDCGRRGCPADCGCGDVSADVAAHGAPAWINRVVTVGLLPETVRDQYHYRWDAKRERQFERTIRSMRAIRRVLPRPLAWVARRSRR
jgi:uncharacterized protein (DUF2236 family)